MRYSVTGFLLMLLPFVALAHTHQNDAPMTVAPVVVSDDFKRHTLGTNWTIYNGDVGVAGDDLAVLSSNAPMLGLMIIAWTADSFSSDQFSEVVLSESHHRKMITQVFVRRNPDTKQRYGMMWSDGKWFLKLDGGPHGGILAKVRGHHVPVPGDRLRIEAIGPVITGYHNGRKVIRVNNTALMGGEPGIAARVVGLERADFPARSVTEWFGGGILRTSSKPPAHVNLIQ